LAAGSPSHPSNLTGGEGKDREIGNPRGKGNEGGAWNGKEGKEKEREGRDHHPSDYGRQPSFSGWIDWSRDRRRHVSAPVEHQKEMAYVGSIGHLTDDVT